MPTIDRRYQKTIHPIGTGYDRRVKGVRPHRVIIHSTNGRRGSSLAKEAEYLRDSGAVGAHYLGGKGGEVLELLDPELRAWHAGAAVPGWGNNDTLGIELHHAVGEAWTLDQREALTWLLKSQLMPAYGITPADIDMHRVIALPHGRKVDPSDWADAGFYAWRASLGDQRYVPQQPPALATYVVLSDVNVREKPSRDNARIALGGHAVLARGFTFQSDVAVPGQALGGNNQWIHMVTPAAWGFVHSSCVQRIA